MGFLDGSERIQDVVLTPEGRRLLSMGRLEFVYFSVHDDGLSYDPINYLSGSLPEEELAEVRRSIEDTPMLEAFSGRPVETAVDVDFTLRPSSFVFDLPVGHRFIPSLQVTPDVTGSLMIVDQGRVEGSSTGDLGSVQRQSDASVRMRVGLDLGGVQDGFLVRMYTSGSDGLTEIIPEIDGMNRLSYGLDVYVLPEESAARASRGEPRTRVAG